MSSKEEKAAICIQLYICMRLSYCIHVRSSSHGLGVVAVSEAVGWIKGHCSSVRLLPLVLSKLQHEALGLFFGGTCLRRGAPSTLLDEKLHKIWLEKRLGVLTISENQYAGTGCQPFNRMCRSLSSNSQGVMRAAQILCLSFGWSAAWLWKHAKAAARAATQEGVLPPCWQLGGSPLAATEFSGMLCSRLEFLCALKAADEERAMGSAVL